MTDIEVAIEWEDDPVVDVNVALADEPVVDVHIELVDPAAGGGAVDSVNGQTGAVQLNLDDIGVDGQPDTNAADALAGGFAQLGSAIDGIGSGLTAEVSTRSTQVAALQTGIEDEAAARIAADEAHELVTDDLSATLHQSPFPTPTRWAVCGGDPLRFFETTEWAAPSTSESLVVEATVRNVTFVPYLDTGIDFQESRSESLDGTGDWDRYETAQQLTDAPSIEDFAEGTKVGGTIEWERGGTQLDDGSLAPARANIWRRVRWYFDLVEKVITTRVADDARWDFVDPDDGTTWATTGVYTNPGIGPLHDSLGHPSWVGRGGGEFHIADTRMWCDGTLVSTFDCAGLEIGATEVYDPTADVTWTAAGGAAVDGPAAVGAVDHSEVTTSGFSGRLEDLSSQQQVNEVLDQLTIPPPPADDNLPQPLGPAPVKGTTGYYADAAHVHPRPAPADIGAATPADITAAIDALVAAAPGALNTLDEMAAALGDDANFAATVTTALAAKVPTTRTINGYDLSANRILTAADVGALASGAATGWAYRASIPFAMLEPKSVGTSWTPQYSAAAGGGFAQGGGQTEQWTYEFPLAAGTYKARCINRHGTNCPIIKFNLSTLGDLGNIDTYNGSTALNQAASLGTGLVIAASGYYVLTLTCSSRNPSNTTGYVMTPQLFEMVRTGA